MSDKQTVREISTCAWNFEFRDLNYIDIVRDGGGKSDTQYLIWKQVGLTNFIWVRAPVAGEKFLFCTFSFCYVFVP